MLTAITVEWATGSHAEAVPVAAATVYLRVRRHEGFIEVTADTLSIGFRSTVIEHPDEVPDLLALVDRALVRARRHAPILAGHALDADLASMTALSATRRPGMVGVHLAWSTRSTQERGLALMVDTSQDANSVDLDTTLDRLRVNMPDSPGRCADVARTALMRCLAVGLTAAVHTSRYRWEGTFPVRHAVDQAGWDVFGNDTRPAQAG